MRDSACYLIAAIGLGVAGCGGAISGDQVEDGGHGGDSGHGSDAGHATDGAKGNEGGHDAASHDASNGGPTMVVSGLAAAPNTMVSDGVTLFWLDSANEYLASAPALGGPVTMLSSEPSLRSLLAVDADNVYVVQGTMPSQDSLVAIPKIGGARTVLSGTGTVVAAAVVGANTYWAEPINPAPPKRPLLDVKSGTVHGGTISLVAQFQALLPPSAMAVTANTVFLENGASLAFLSLTSGAPDAAAPQAVTGATNGGCDLLLADHADAYCLSLSGGPILKVDSSGTAATLAMATSVSSGTLDASYLYWCDNPAPGAVIQKVALAGGTPTVLVKNERAVAMAVDEAAIYWATSDGSIERQLK